MKCREISEKLKDKIGFEYEPVAIYHADEMPNDAISFKEKGNGCIMPLIFQAAKGKIVSFDKDKTGWACSAFYLGYEKWIFEGIECFLSNEPIYGREPERFTKSPADAKEYVESLVPDELNDKSVVFEPLSKCRVETPEFVTFFANADEISALIFLIYYLYPQRDDIVASRFASACAAVYTLPIKYKADDKLKAVWGMHDIAARTRLPKHLTTLTLPYSLLEEIGEIINESFLSTHNWQTIKTRNVGE